MNSFIQWTLLSSSTLKKVGKYPAAGHIILRPPNQYTSGDESEQDSLERCYLLRIFTQSADISITLNQ